MKKSRLLNDQISSLIARLGHGDTICICDAGLPVPDGVQRIDLAVSEGVPGLLVTLDAIIFEMMVESALMADELAVGQSDLYAGVTNSLNDLRQSQGNALLVETVPHDQFKHHSTKCKAIIRTGEFTPYANIILSAGVVF